MVGRQRTCCRNMCEPRSLTCMLSHSPHSIFSFLALPVNSYTWHCVLYADLSHFLNTGGAAGAVSRITGTLGKGLASLTLDEEYQKKRQAQLNKRPATATEGFARGGKGLVMVCPHAFHLYFQSFSPCNVSVHFSSLF